MSHYSNHLFTPGSVNNSWSHLYDYISEGDEVLDVGCSSGNFGEVLIQLKNCTVTGIDLDKKDITEAKKKLNKAIVGDINDISLIAKLGKYDIIIFADVLEHLTDPRQTLENVKQLLKPNGQVLFSIPHMGHMSVRLGLMTGKFNYADRGLLDRTHLHFYDKDEVEAIFNDADYRIKEVRPVISRYTSDMINQKLRDMGLRSSKEFVKYLDNSSGDIFQFIGTATPAKTSQKKHVRKIKYIMPQDEIYQHAQAVLKDNAELNATVQRLMDENKSLELKTISNTKPLRAVKKIARIAKRIVKQ